jgi:hypothetical protein
MCLLPLMGVPSGALCRGAWTSSRTGWPHKKLGLALGVTRRLQNLGKGGLGMQGISTGQSGSTAWSYCSGNQAGGQLPARGYKLVLVRMTLCRRCRRGGLRWCRLRRCRGCRLRRCRGCRRRWLGSTGCILARISRIHWGRLCRCLRMGAGEASAICNDVGAGLHCSQGNISRKAFRSRAA